MISLTSTLAGMQELISLDRPYRPLLTVRAVTKPNMSRLEIRPEIRRCVTDPVARLVGRRRADPTVIDLSVGLVSLLEGLTRQEQSGTLGSSGRSTDRRWSRAVDTYLRGLTD